MNTRLILSFLIVQASHTYAQSILPPLHEDPKTGFLQLEAEHPYILIQKDTGNADWKNSQRLTWQKNPAGYLTMRAADKWSENQTWISERSESYRFISGPGGRIDTMYSATIFHLTDFSTISNSIYRYSFNEKNLITHVSCLDEWSPSSGKYDKSLEITAWYDLEGNRKRDSTYSYIGKRSWIDAHSYNNSGKLTASIRTVNSDTVIRELLTYDTEGHLYTIFKETFNIDSALWYPDKSDTFLYDAAGHISQRIAWRKSYPDGISKPIFQRDHNESYQYSAEGKLIEIIKKAGDDNGWKNDTKTTVQYDASGNPVIGYVYYSSGISWSDTPFQRYLFTFPTGIKNLQQASTLELYPNPVEHTLMLSYSASNPVRMITIMDLNGRCVYQTGNMETNGIDVSKISNGLYFVTLTTDQSSVSKKILILH
jgi:hypothetical protein